MKEKLRVDIQTKEKVIVAIPAYNEEISIGSVIARCKKYVDTVYVIDDGSDDHTVEVARLVGAEIASHGKNCGYGAGPK
jgi:glycosyltransferase involved in cell wall biosynthesis